MMTTLIFFPSLTIKILQNRCRSSHKSNGLFILILFYFSIRACLRACLYVCSNGIGKIAFLDMTRDLTD